MELMHIGFSNTRIFLAFVFFVLAVFYLNYTLFMLSLFLAIAGKM